MQVLALGFIVVPIALPPISLSYEKAVTDKISVGGIVGYSSSQYNYGFGGSSYKWKYSYLFIGLRGNYNFATTEKFDPYAGLTLGYNIVGVKSPGQARIIPQKEVHFYL